MSAIAEALRETNRRLRALLEAVAPGSEQAVPATAEQLSGFFTELLQAGELLRQMPARGNDPALEKELDAYQANVERLQSLLPAMQAHLLAQRAQLEAERRQLQAASAWAHTARKTT